jgi:hypothetical protein
MSLNIVASLFTLDERWTKLYRTIHHLFLRKEFIHIQDYNFMVQEMNNRISVIETKLNTELQKIALGMMTHVHPSPPAPVNPVITGPVAAAPYTPGFSPTPLVKPQTTFMEQADAVLQSLGPAQAPLADGIAPDQLQANTKIRSTIGAV